MAKKKSVVVADSTTGEVIEAASQKLARYEEIRAKEFAINKMENTIDEMSDNLKESKKILKKTQRELRQLINSDPAEELQFEN